MDQAHVEEYLAAIYRLRESSQIQLPLSKLEKYLNYSPISIHEMIQKLEKKSLVNYTPYHGLTLTKEGERLASAIVRSHRIWECFLTDSLSLNWEQAHEIAGRLEHAAPEMVTEKLADFLDNPQNCPHGNPIPMAIDDEGAPNKDGSLDETGNGLVRMDKADSKRALQIIYISPEISSSLKKLTKWGIQPGTCVEILKQGTKYYQIKVKDEIIKVPEAIIHTLWVKEL